MDYITLTDADKLQIAEGALRGAESDHYRLTIQEIPGGPARQEQLEGQIKVLKATVDELRAVVNPDGA